MNIGSSIGIKITTFVLAVAILAPIAPIGVNRAHAIPVTKVADVDIIRPILDGLAWSAAKVVVQSLTRSTVNWINSGFQGSPGFITDLEQHLRNLSDSIAREFLNELTVSFTIRSPFVSDVTNALRGNYLRSTSPNAYQELNQYTLGDTCPNDAAFIAGNFAQGGFRCWMAAWRTSANNPFGAYRNAEAELNRRIAAARENRRIELDWGRGYISWRGECLDSPNPKPGEGASEASGSETLSSEEGCSQYAIRTPGSVIENTMMLHLGSGVKQLELADSINEIVGALMTQMVSKVVGGAGGLLGLSQPNPSQGGRPFIGGPAESGVTLAEGFEQEVQTARVRSTAFQANWLTIQASAQEAQTACQDNSVARGQITETLEDAQEALQGIGTTLATLNNILNLIAQAYSETTPQAQAARSAQATTAWQNLLRTGTIPTETELDFALTNSRTTEAGGETTLLSRMNAFAANCD